MTDVLYDKFEMPEAIKVAGEPQAASSARFVAEPLERGIGHTLGNALRRMLLTSIEAPAIISIFIEGVPHEYCSIEGVIEDMTTIILNLKGALLRRIILDEECENTREQKIVLKDLEITQADLAENGQKVVTLGDLVESGLYEVVNPELPIFTVTAPMHKRVEVKISQGRGYVSSERHELLSQSVGEIVVDSIFSPVRLVNYFVEDTRVGQDTDFDRLILEVTTDGRITPQEALAFASKILTKHLIVFEKMDEHEIAFEEARPIVDSDQGELMQKLALGINEIELSVRSTNCLNGANIETIGELVVMPEPQLLQFRNFGKKSLNEIRAKLYEMSLGLGMDLTRFGITQENVREKIQKFREEQEKNLGT